MTDTRLVKGCCPLDCQDTCAWVAHVQDDRVVRVEGARDHPFTRGALCAKVNDYPTRTYAADRLLAPLRRVGAKGAGTFVRIGWDEALDTVAERFRAIIAAHGAEALLPLNYLGSMGVVQRRALMRIFHALGASRPYGSICGASGNVVADEGHPRGFDPETIVDSRYVLVWGANPLTTCHHHWHFIEEARRRHGARLVCIDPRRTRTAERCDRHLAIRPATDRFLAAGIARVMLEEGTADLEFASGAALDLEAFREEVRPWTPDRVAAVCGLDADDVTALARDFALARPATIRAGISPQQTVEGEAFVRSLSALAILGGHWRLPGGGLFLEASPVLHESRAARPDLMPGAPRRLDLARLGETLTSTELSPRIHGVMIWATNPAVVQPDTARVCRGLAREDLFTVVLEHFMTDTARYADIVLPATTQLEHFDIVGAWGHHYVSVNHPAVRPLGEAKSHGEVMRLLAPRLGLTHAAFRQSDEQIAASALPDGLDLEELKAAGWRKTTPPRAPLLDGGRRVRLCGIASEPAEGPDAGTLRLLTPKSHYFLNSSFGNMGRHRRGMQRPTLEMHPSDAGARGLADGERVVVGSAGAELRVWLRVTEEIRPGAVALPGKWWSHPTETSAVANLLTPSAWSPGGQPAYNDTFVTVTAAGAAAAGVEAGGVILRPMTDTALHTLLARSIDYAGLFPPAALDMATAVRSYAEYRAGPDAWALGRFVVPAARLPELEGEAESLAPRSPADPWRLSVLVGDGAAQELEALGELNCRHAAAGAAALSGDVVEAKAGTVDAIDRLARALPRWATAYVEVPLEPDPAPLLAAIARHGLGAKARTGGVTPDAFPAPDALLRFLRACTAADLPFKVTAGLHHPLRAEYRLTYAPDSPTGTMYGFLNVFLAAAFLRSGLPDPKVVELLQERSPDAFRFLPDAIEWRGSRVDHPTIAATRAQGIGGFGSCSFMEPVGELKAVV